MAKILNTLLCTVAVFLLTFLWIYYCLKDSTLALWLSLAVALCASYVIWRAQSHWETGKQTKLAQKNKLTTFGEFLRFGLDNATLFADMMRYYRFDVIPVDYDNLIVSKNEIKSYVAIRFVQDSVSKDDLTKAVIAAKRAQCNKLYVFACKVDRTLIELANRHLPTVTVDLNNTYTLFEQCDKLPPLPSKPQIKKSPFVAKYAFSRRRFGWYFGSSLFMLAISVVSYFPWYTLSWATVFLILAVYCLVNKRFNVLPTRVTLD